MRSRECDLEWQTKIEFGRRKIILVYEVVFTREERFTRSLCLELGRRKEVHKVPMFGIWPENCASQNEGVMKSRSLVTLMGILYYGGVWECLSRCAYNLIA